MKKLLSIILVLLMLCSLVLTACSDDPGNSETQPGGSGETESGGSGETESGGSSETESGGSGETEPGTHTCESVCPTCGRCTDNSCTETACVNKCQGHTPAPDTHTCESVCPICGNCMDETCTEDECEEKCAGHEQSEMTVAQFVANTSNYLTDANEGLSAAAAALGSSIELSYADPFFPMATPMSARAIIRSSGVNLLLARTYNAGNSIVLLSDTKDEMMMCAKCGEVEVTTEQKYCDACKEAMGGQTNPKNYSTGETLEQYIIFNSVARKIQLIVGATEYYTEYDFPFPNEYELTLIGTIKFEGEFTKLLKEIEDYELGEDGFYVIEEPQYADGTWNPEIGGFDKDLGGQTLIGKRVRGFKLEGNTLITSTYYVSYDYMNNNEESISEEVYVEYTMDGNNFYYEKYKMVEGQKVVVDMFDIIKEEPNENTLGDVYYVQMTLNGEEEITGMPAVYFEEAVDIADQWQRYVNEKMGTGYHAEVPTKVYLNGRIQKVDNDVMYDMYYFRDYDYAVAGYESSCYVYPIENWEEFYGEYFYEYTRGDSAPLPESWENGFDTNLGANLEGMIEDSLYGKYAETLVFRASGNIQTSSEWAKYYPFELKESSATLDINDSYEIIASSADEAVWSVSSSNEEVATVNGLTVQSGSVEGEAIITVQRNNLVRYFRVLVRNRLVTDSTEEMTIRLGTTAHAVFNAYSNQNETLEFYSDNEEIVTIDEYGVITAHKKGDTTVWVKTQDGARFEKMFVHVVNTVDITDLYLPSEYGIGESYHASMHLMGLGGISVTYDTVLDANTEYYMVFDGLDIEGYVYPLRVNGQNYADQSDVVVTEVYDEWTDDAGYHYELMKDYRSVTFKNAGTYKLEYWTYTDPIGYQYVSPNNVDDSGVLEARQLVLLEINVTVDTQLPYRYDETTNTFFVKDYEGLLAWYDAQQIDKSTNVTLEADIVMPTENFLFDLNDDGINESNWGLGVKNYKGTFDGNTHTIYNLTMKAGSTKAVGFIYSLIEKGVVVDLTMKGSDLVGSKVGGIVVNVLQNCKVMGCVNYSDITGTKGAGGIVYDVETGGFVAGCTNYGDITGGAFNVGGICGYAWFPKAIIGCANYGTVTGPKSANGIVGYIYLKESRIKACFNAGEVVATGDTRTGYAISHTGFDWCYCTNGSTEYSGTLQYLNDRVHYIDGENYTFAEAVEDMNAAIEQYNATATVKCNYRYVLNTDPETSEAYPLILQEVTDAQE